MSFLQIGSWNIEHLSQRRENKQSIYALCDHIEMAGLDILCVQEIYDTDRQAGTKTNKDLDGVCHLLREHSGHLWTYRLLPNRSPGDVSQLCGFLWNTSRVRESRVVRLGVENQSGPLKLWDRHPHAVTFAMPLKRWRKEGERWVSFDSESSISIVNLHMKSNYGDAMAGRRVREAEAKTLVQALANAAPGDIDPSLLLIGDTNMLMREEPAAIAFADAGFRDLNATDAHTYPGYRGAPFDRAYVRRDRKEFRYTRQYVLQSADEMLHDRFLSDHYMIKVSVKMYVDDTDPREIR